MRGRANPEHWRTKRTRYRLEGRRCIACGEPVFPPRLKCQFCVSESVEIARVDVSQAQVESHQMIVEDINIEPAGSS